LLILTTINNRQQLIPTKIPRAPSSWSDREALCQPRAREQWPEDRTEAGISLKLMAIIYEIFKKGIPELSPLLENRSELLNRRIKRFDDITLGAGCSSTNSSFK